MRERERTYRGHAARLLSESGLRRRRGDGGSGERDGHAGNVARVGGGHHGGEGGGGGGDEGGRGARGGGGESCGLDFSRCLGRQGNGRLGEERRGGPARRREFQ